jgi:signal transduction histidine kinase
MHEHAMRTGGETADLEVVRSEVRRMSLLLDQFLDFARPRAPRFQRQRLDEILEETLLLIGPEAGKRGIEIRRRVEADTPAIWADGDQLKQAFLNLGLNALQATPRDGVVSLGLHRAAGGLVVEVADSGEGISEEIRERLFEPFFTTRGNGTGLGLPISLRIVEGHSGKLTLASEPGGGVSATVWLPL